MSLVTEPWALANAASGMLLIALGAWVASRRPRRRGNAAFGLFSAGFGFGFIWTDVLTGDDPLEGTVLWLAAAGWVAATIALALVAREVPRPLASEEVRLAHLPLVLGALFAVGAGWSVATAVVEYPAAFDIPPSLAMPLAAVGLASSALEGALWATVLLLLARARGGQGEDRFLLFAGALLLYPSSSLGIQLGEILTAARDSGPVPAPLGEAGLPFTLSVLVPGVLCLLAVAVAAMGAARRGASSRAYRNLALLGPAIALLGLLTELAAFTGLNGIARTGTVLLLAYAILRHQLLGLDVKVRWTLKQSTVAAAFVGVFFVASEGAQAFFGRAAGSEWLGILAAGALVFAMAPLQRAAERVAAVAVPLGGAPEASPAASGAGGSALEDYRAAFLVAARDGRLSPEEELALARLADRLGLGAEAVVRLRQETLRIPRRERN